MQHKEIVLTPNQWVQRTNYTEKHNSIVPIVYITIYVDYNFDHNKKWRMEPGKVVEQKQVDSQTLWLAGLHKSKAI